MKTSNSHIVITGAGRGIGAAIAKCLGESASRITLMGRQASSLESVAAELPNAQVVTVDVTNSAGVKEAFAKARAAFGPVDTLINNAGAASTAPAHKTSDEQWRSMLSVNLDGVFYCCREVLNDMRTAGAGRIVNIASTAGLKGYGYVAAYCAAKHGVIGLTRALATELATKGITVNAVCPGYTETDIVSTAVATICEKTGRSEAEARAELVKDNPQGRFIQPDEIAATVAWLCSDAAMSVTGQAIAVAGGEVM